MESLIWTEGSGFNMFSGTLRQWIICWVSFEVQLFADGSPLMIHMERNLNQVTIFWYYEHIGNLQKLLFEQIINGRRQIYEKDAVKFQLIILHKQN